MQPIPCHRHVRAQRVAVIVERLVLLFVETVALEAGEAVCVAGLRKVVPLAAHFRAYGDKVAPNHLQHRLLV